MVMKGKQWIKLDERKKYLGKHGVGHPDDYMIYIDDNLKYVTDNYRNVKKRAMEFKDANPDSEVHIKFKHHLYEVVRGTRVKWTWVQLY